MKKFIIAILALPLLFFLFLYLYVQNLDEGEIKRLIISQLEQKINGKVQVQNFAMQGFSTLNLQGLEIRALSGEEVFSARSIEIHLALSELIRSKLSISSVDLIGPQLRIKKKGDEFNFQGLIKKPQDSGLGSQGLSMQARDPNAGLKIEAFTISEGVLRYEDLPSVFFQLKGSFLDEIMTVKKLNATLNKGQTRIAADLSFNLKTQELTVNTQNVLVNLKELEGLLQNPGLSGELEAKGSFHVVKEKLTPNLTVAIRNLRGLGGIESLEGTLQWSQQDLLLLGKIHKKELGKTDIQAQGKFIPARDLKDMVLKLTLNGSNRGKTPFRFQGSTRWQSPILYVEKAELKAYDVELGLDGFYTPNTKKGVFQASGLVSRFSRFVEGLDMPVQFEANLDTSPEGLQLSSKLDSATGVKYQGLSLQPFTLELQSSSDGENFELTAAQFQFKDGGNLKVGGKGKVDSPANFVGNLTARALKLQVFRDGMTAAESFEIEDLNAGFHSGNFMVKNLRAVHGKKGSGAMMMAMGSGVISDPLKGSYSMEFRSFTPGLVLPDLMPWKVSGQCSIPGKCSIQANHSGGQSSLQASFSADTNAMEESVKTVSASGVVECADFQSFLPKGQSCKGSVQLGMKPVPTGFSMELSSRSLSMGTTTLAKDLMISNLNSQMFLDQDFSRLKIIKLVSQSMGGQILLTGELLPRDFKNLAKLDVRLSEVQIPQLLSTFSASLEGQASGLVSGQVKPLKISFPADELDLDMKGQFDVKSLVYRYPASIIQGLDSMEGSIRNSILSRLANYEKEKWKMRMDQSARFQDIQNLDFTMKDWRLLIPQYALIQKEEDYLIQSASAFLMDMNPKKPEPTVSTSFDLVMREKFLREKFPFLKDAPLGELKDRILIQGLVSDPIPASEINRLKSSWSKKVLSMIDFKVLGKSLEDKFQAAKQDLLQNKEELIQRKSQELIEKGSGFLNKVLGSSGTENVKSQGASAVETRVEEIKERAQKKLKSFLGDLFK